MTETSTIVAQSTRVGLVLEPLDVLFFRDGRPFGASLRGESLDMALPQTLAGAVWTAVLQSYRCNFRQLAERVQSGESFEEAVAAMELPAWIAEVQVRGPWLAWAPLGDLSNTAPELLFPVPSSLHRPKKGPAERLIRLAPLSSKESVPGWHLTRSIPDPLLQPLWHRVREATEPAKGFLTTEGMRAFLAGEEVAPGSRIDAEALFGFDHRTGIGINPQSLSAEESLIYTASFLSLRREPDKHRQVAFYCEVLFPDGAPDSAVEVIRTMPLGGEGRRVAVHRLRKPFDFARLNCGPSPSRPNSLVVLTTPSPFEARWRPAALADRVVSASVAGAIPVSGWDLARGGPKPSRFAVPAGSVYFAEGELTNLPSCLADSESDRRQGWGCYLTGVWNDDDNRC